MTAAQQRALDELFPRFGIPADGNEIDFDHAFDRNALRTLEIGFGNGEVLIQMAKAEPESDFIGIEVHRPGVGRVLNQMKEEGIANIRVMNGDAVEIFQRQIPDNNLDRVLLFFPDPWHKRKHHKRRILNAEFVQLVRQKLKRGAVWHMATDWEDYAEHMLAVMSQAEGFENVSGAGQFTPRPDYRPLTKFEQRGQRLGHGVWDLLFKRIDQLQS